mmetsp:Transcript_21962/g.63307  ORF Transcript_21962/g.63307 Transcript_21962/m.63307 type:complete len:250 (-) Transcript_21962:490-1239(-)
MLLRVPMQRWQDAHSPGLLAAQATLLRDPARLRRGGQQRQACLPEQEARRGIRIPAGCRPRRGALGHAPQRLPAALGLASAGARLREPCSHGVAAGSRRAACAAPLSWECHRCWLHDGPLPGARGGPGDGGRGRGVQRLRCCGRQPGHQQHRLRHRGGLRPRRGGRRRAQEDRRLRAERGQRARRAPRGSTARGRPRAALAPGQRPEGHRPQSWRLLSTFTHALLLRHLQERHKDLPGELPGAHNARAA